jgi:Phage tail sheath protein subtilisin-like domain/Phage tail sheath C-terminal domain
MSVSKFRFVSPGVQVHEIDNSQLPRVPEAIGPVIIGRSLRGPMMRPVRVDSFSDFIDVFGEPVAGGQVGDLWRDGNRLTPTYGAYAAQAYLKSTSPVTFVRLGGYQYNHDNAGLEQRAGWSVDDAYGLFLAPTTGSGANYKVSGSAYLAAIVYHTGSSQIGLVGRSLTGSVDDVDGLSQVWVRADNTYAETRLLVDGNKYSFNLNKDSRKYIRNILNTNATALSLKNNPKHYFLGESYASWVEKELINNAPSSALKIADGNSANGLAAILLKLSDYNNFKQEATDANDYNGHPLAGWIISQHLGATGSYTSVNGQYPMQKLFKFVGITEGEWNSQNLKVAIEDIKLPINDYVKYGTFTVSIRRSGDSDVRPEYVERYSGLSLDPSSENYIAKRIGDKYTVWDYEKKSYVEYGTYDNVSKFIRVEMDDAVDAGAAEAGLLPFGFYGPKTFKNNSVVVTGRTFTEYLLSDNHITGAGQQWTASFALPTVPLLSSSSDSTSPSLLGINWGIQTTLNASRKTNPDYPDFVRAFPSTQATSNDITTQFMFSLDDVSGTLSGSGDDAVIYELSGATWQQDNRKNGLSISANVSGSGIKTLLTKFNKFIVPLAGGFDGLDITKPEPFANTLLEEVNGYANNSVKVAIESIADAEVVEMNLATIPGVTNKGLVGQLIDKCELRGDALAIVDLEGDYDPEDPKKKPDVKSVLQTVKNFANTSYGCTYFPWVLVKDTLNNNKVWVPPSVVALGTFASSEMKTELWFAPAGFNRGGLSGGAAGLPVLQTSLRLTSKDRDDLYEANINPIATFPAEGIVIFGQKTLQVTPSALDRINVRRLMIYVKKEISRMASTVLFDPNVEVTWKRFLDKANPFLASVKSRFGLTAFKVVLDGTTTTPDLIDRNIVYAKILLQPARAIEFIALDFVISNTGASFAD